MTSMTTIASEILGHKALPAANSSVAAPYAVSFDDIVKAHHVLEGPVYFARVENATRKGQALDIRLNELDRRQPLARRACGLNQRHA